MPFDLAKDFAPIALVNAVTVVLVVPPTLGVNSVKELIALAKSKPGELLYASTGVGTRRILAGELFMRAGLKLVQCPTGQPAGGHRSAGRPRQHDVLAGSTVVAQAEAGKLKLLATAASKRAGILPDTPTMAEAGMPDFDTSIWFGLVAPAGTPRPVIDKLVARRARGREVGRGGEGLATAGHRSARRRARGSGAPHRPARPSAGAKWRRRPG